MRLIQMPLFLVAVFQMKLDSLEEGKNNRAITSKVSLNEKNLKTVFLKPIYGDASGVRGAALLGRQNLIILNSYSIFIFIK